MQRPTGLKYFSTKFASSISGISAEGSLVTQRRPPVRFDSRDYARAYSSHSPGYVSGSGSARLDLSQKGDLPSAGERASFNWSKVTDARNS